MLTDDHNDDKSHEILAELEKIDEVCDSKSISFVKIDDDGVAREYGVDVIPTLVYFENKIPSLYHGDLLNEEMVLAWLVEQTTSDMIEDITDEMLDKLIKKSSHLAVLFCKSFKKKKRNIFMYNSIPGIIAVYSCLKLFTSGDVEKCGRELRRIPAFLWRPN